MNNSLKIQFTIIILLITVSSVLPVLALPLENTFIWWSIYTASIFVIIRGIRLSKSFVNSESKNLRFLQLLLMWYTFCIIRGCFVADNYWEWKNLLETSFSMMLCLVVYLAVNPFFFSYITHKWLRYALPMFFLFLPFLHGDGSGRYLAPVSITLLFFSLLTNKWKIILLGFSLFVFFGSLDARSNIIKFSVSFLIGLGVYIGLYKFKRVIKVLYLVMLFFPVILFVLGISGTFNIFNIEGYISDNNLNKKIFQDGKEIHITADTRTSLYEEVLMSSVKYNYFIWGRTPARGNESFLFGDIMRRVTNLNTKERFSNEVSILNIFTWTGVVGVLLYFFIFAKAGFLTVFRSKNQYSRLLGIYLMFRWCYAWVEDFNTFNLSYLYLWFIVGLCYSIQFREMNDLQVRVWFRSIFDSKYTKKNIKANRLVLDKSQEKL